MRWYMRPELGLVLFAVVSATGAPLAAAGDIHRHMPMHMANIRHDCLTNQNTDWCFVVIGLGRKTIPQSFAAAKNRSRSPQMGPPYWLAPSRCQRIFINIRGQYGIQKNVYIHPWLVHMTVVFFYVYLDFYFFCVCIYWLVTISTITYFNF